MVVPNDPLPHAAGQGRVTSKKMLAAANLLLLQWKFVWVEILKLLGNGSKIISFFPGGAVASKPANTHTNKSGKICFMTIIVLQELSNSPQVSKDHLNGIKAGNPVVKRVNTLGVDSPPLSNKWIN